MGSREVALEFEPLYAAATQAGRRQACQPRCATKAIERTGLAQLAETPLAVTTLRQRGERIEPAERGAPLGGGGGRERPGRGRGALGGAAAEVPRPGAHQLPRRAAADIGRPQLL